MTSNSCAIIRKPKKPSFNIYRSDGSIFPSLKNSFLIKDRITLWDRAKGYLELPDGTFWTLLLEPTVELELLNNRAWVDCIISYQAHDHGNYAIARKCIATKIKATKPKEKESSHVS